jgi:hypothetical protein
MPDGVHFSTVRVEADSAQRLWKFALRGDESPTLLIEKIQPVGYHVWASDVTLGGRVARGSPRSTCSRDARLPLPNHPTRRTTTCGRPTAFSSLAAAHACWRGWTDGGMSSLTSPWTACARFHDSR